MKRAIQLAKRGQGTASPNPIVGAVVVKNNFVIGEGFHLKRGEDHAEVVAIRSATESVSGATLFCTLEPCCHTKKLTPPCTELIIGSGISKVVIGSKDVNPEVSGKGIELLKSAGIEVISGVLENECTHLNKPFNKFMKTGNPFIHLKVAMTLDGRMATDSNSSKWITSEYARSEVHDLRKKYDAVLIGRQTLLSDNPSLNTRSGNKVIKENYKIILGSGKGISDSLNIFRDTSKVHVITNDQSSWGDLEIPKENVHSLGNDITAALTEIAKRGILSILVEGGPRTISTFIREDIYDCITFFISPKLIGNGSSVYMSNEVQEMENALNLDGQWRIGKSNEAIYEVEK